MEVREDFELMESLLVVLDPLTDGFAGVLLEIFRSGDEHVFVETVPTTGNRLLRFSSRDKGMVYGALARELGDGATPG